ncbi:MAG TPA: MFS transporter [Ktedonobacteraceae bacterium]
MALRFGQRKKSVSALSRFFINRSFGLLWGGQTISVLGSYITSSSLPLIAILVLGASPAQVGLLTALGALPGLFFSLPIGLWVDRLPRRWLLLLADLLRALLLLSLPLASLSGWLHIEQLYIIIVLLSTCTICFDTAYQAFLPQIVAAEQLIESNSKLGISSSLAEMGGPSLAGVLIQLLGAPLAVFFDALSFLVSALSLGLMRTRETRLVMPIEEREPFWRQLRVGFHTLLAHPLLRALAIYTTVRTFFGGTFATLYAIYIVRELSIAPALYGLLVALGGLGALLGSLLLPSLTRRFGAKQILLAGALLHSSLALIVPLAGQPLAVAFGILGISQLIGDIGFQLHALTEVGLRQRSIPIHLQGRVNAMIGFLVSGVAPSGALLAGICSIYLGIRLTLLVGAGGMLLSALWLLFALRKYRE